MTDLVYVLERLLESIKTGKKTIKDVYVYSENEKVGEAERGTGVWNWSITTEDVSEASK